jgi:hypothetical protein
MRSTDRCAWLLAAVALVLGGHFAQAANPSTHAPQVEFVMTSGSVVAPAQNASLVSVAAPLHDNVLVNGIRSQDEIVLVDMRGLGCSCDAANMAERARVSIYAAGDESGCRRWMPSDMQSVIGNDPGMSTVIFVHGNRLTAWDAKSEGLRVYRKMACQNPAGPAIRFVIFSWPSAQISGPLRDVREKAARTGPAGCQLAWVIDQFPSDTPMTLVGFSFGARIITGALHVLGGGSLGHCCLELQHPGRRPADVVLMAAAVHSDWLCPGHCHGMAMTQVNQMLLVNNCNDTAMKYYRFVSKYGRPQALGYCGPTCIDPVGASKIVERNASRWVGNEHNLFCYISVPGVIGEIWDYADSQAPVVAGL